MKHINQLNLFDKEINQEDYEEEFKVCYDCNKSLPISFFPYSCAAKKWRRRECKTCRGEYSSYLSKLKRTHALPENHKCPICLVGDVNEVGKEVKWNLDHDHVTDKFRDFICESCNKGLGMFKDNISLLEKAINYLKEHDETER